MFMPLRGGHVAYENDRLLPFLLRLADNSYSEEFIYASLSEIWNDYRSNFGKK